MNQKRWRNRHLAGWLLIALGGLVFAQEPERGAGVVIETLDEDAALFAAGVRIGDRITAWVRLANEANPEEAQGSIADYFDWWVLAKTQAPRGTVRLFGERDGAPYEIEVDNDYWEATVHPVMPEEKLAVYLTGKRQIDADEIETGVKTWESLAQGTVACWMWLHIGNLLRDAQKYDDAQAAYNRALGNTEHHVQKAVIWNRIGSTLEKLESWEQALEAYREAIGYCTNFEGGDLGIAYFTTSMGIVAQGRGDLAEAERLYRQALVIQEQKAPHSLELAFTLNSLGIVAWAQGDLAAVQRLFQQAFNIQEQKLLNSPDLAGTLNNMGTVAWARGDLAEAERRYQQALAIHEQKAPNSLDLAGTLYNLGIVTRDRGALGEAERLHRQALIIYEQKAPNSLTLAHIFNSLGLVAWAQGDLAEAERLYRQALVICEQKTPNSPDLANTLNNLGLVASDRGDLVEAERLYRQALVIFEQKAPNSLDLANTLNNLGNVVRARGDLAEAERLYRQVLAIYEQKTPNSLAQANTLNNLGLVASDRGDLAEAERRFQQSLAIYEQKAPNSLNWAASLTNLGLVALKRGDLAEAEKFYQQALVIQKRKAIGSLNLASTHNNLAKIYQAMKQTIQAQNFYERSLDGLDAQLGLLGGSQQIKMGFLTQSQNYYREYLSYLMEQRNLERAFEIHERSRAKVLRDMMAERGLVLSEKNLPVELDSERSRLTYAYERTQTQLLENPEKEEALLAELNDVRRQYDEVKRQIRELSPELASLRYPQAMDLPAIQAMLDPGTLLLAYCVMEDRTILFMVRRDGELSAITIPQGNQFLQKLINRWLQLATDAKLGQVGMKIFEETGIELSRLLIEPARAKIERAQRLLIIPDGPLWYVPFGALPISGEGGQRYLIEAKPITTAVSASLYAELKARPKRGITRIVAMGDAVYPSEKTGKDRRRRGQADKTQSRGPSPSTEAENDGVFEPRVRSLMDRTSAQTFGRIPHTAREVRSIARLYGPAVRSYLREEANETHFKQIGGDVDIVHVAAHGLVDDVNPLDSALLLTINDDFQPGEESGVVFAWEVFESIRLNADLVVLSACETGLGKVSGGEGLIGLTRAFQFAGARSIMASYWNVEDGTTAVLMGEFYGNLKAGMDKAEALRQAQITLIREPIEIPRTGWRKFLPAQKFTAAHPYYWAPFQLIGPWD